MSAYWRRVNDGLYKGSTQLFPNVAAMAYLLITIVYS